MSLYTDPTLSAIMTTPSGGAARPQPTPPAPTPTAAREPLPPSPASAATPAPTPVTPPTPALPPTRPNTPTNQPTQCCPLESLPCDVRKLTVRALVQGKESKDRILTAERRLRGRPVSRPVPAEVTAFLNRYDLVIDVVASYPTLEVPTPETTVKIQGFSDYHGDACSRNEHPLMKLTALTVAEELRNSPGGLTWKAKETEPRVFSARDLIEEAVQAEDKLGAIFAIFLSIWPGSFQKHLVVQALGCGRRAPSGGEPVQELAALVRIFRADAWTITYKFPPLGEYKFKRSGTIGGREAERARPVTASAPAGSTGRPGESSTELLPEPIRLPAGASISIKRNGREMTPPRLQAILEKIVKIGEVVKGGLEALQRLPQIGWEVKLSLSIVQGSIEGQWAPVMVEPAIDERYLPVTIGFSLTIDIMLLEVSAELSFGLEARSRGASIVLRVAGKIGCKVPLKVTLTDYARPVEVKLTPTITCELSGIAEASFLGLSIRAEVTVKGGITLDGKFVSTPERGPHLEGVVKRDPIILSGKLHRWWGPDREMDPITLLPGAELAKL